MAAEINAAEDAFIVGNGASCVVMHLPSLGPFHDMTCAEGENRDCKDSKENKGKGNSVGYFRDLRNLLSAYVKSDIALSSNFQCASSSTPDGIIRNRQAEVFISLVLDVRQAASSLELAAPALQALQMLLQSQWQPVNAFTPDFLSVLVSLLSSSDENNEQHSNSSSAIAEDLISTIFRKLPRNLDLMLDILFQTLRHESTVSSVAQISILSQALGRYWMTSLPSITDQLVKKISVSSKHEILGMSKVKADNTWRSALTLGDTLETPIGAVWMTASIVKIDRRSDNLTLEYRSGASLSLLQVHRTTGRIRPVGSQSNDNFRVGDLTKLNEDLPCAADGVVGSGIHYAVRKYHDLRLGLCFNYMKPPRRHIDTREHTPSGMSAEKECAAPKCLSDHDMVVSSESQLTTCFICDMIPAYEECKGPRGWYCNTCRYYICYSCYPETSEATETSDPPHSFEVCGASEGYGATETAGATQFLFLHGPVGGTLAPCFADPGHLLAYGIRSGEVIEVDIPHSTRSYNSAISALESEDREENGWNSRSDYYRLTSGAGYVPRHPVGWTWHPLPSDPSNGVVASGEPYDRVIDREPDRLTDRLSDAFDAKKLHSFIAPTPDFPSISSCTSPEALTPVTPPPPHTFYANTAHNTYSTSAHHTHRSINSHVTQYPHNASSPCASSSSASSSTPNFMNHKVQGPRNYGVPDLVDLIIKLDRARKNELIQIVDKTENAKNAVNGSKEGQLKVASVVVELLQCALAVFEKVSIGIISKFSITKFAFVLFICLPVS